MKNDLPVVSAGEQGAGELLATIKREGRIVVQTEFLGSEHDVVLR